MTLEDYLKKRIARNEHRLGPDAFIVKQQRAQLASIQEGQPSTYLQFTAGARSFGANPVPSLRDNGEPSDEPENEEE